MNAADIIADRLVTRGIYLERYKAGFNAKILAELEKLEDELTRELASAFAKGIPNPTQRIQRLEKLLGQTRHIIKRTYAEKSSLAGKELLRLAANEQLYVVDAINEAAGIQIAERTLVYEELKKLTDGTLIEGAKSADWWTRQSDDLQKRFSDQMRMGILRGETLDQLVARVRGTQANGFQDGIMRLSRRQADALIRTSVQTIANATRDEFYAANSDIISAVQWIATLDHRTTHICMALHGKMWTTSTKKPIGHSIQYPGATAHWGCRSTQVAILKAWEDLVASQDKDEVNEEYRRQLKRQGFSDEEVEKIVADSRYSLDGKAAKDITFDEWLSSKTPEFQDRMLGRGRGKLFRDGKITLTDLIDQTGRPLTIEQLEALPFPRPSGRPIKLPTPRRRTPKPAPAPAPTRAPGEFPPVDEIKPLRKLGGSTGAELVADTKTGELYVLKRGKTADHLREEFAADQAYRAAGLNVPRGILHETPNGPVKLTQHIEGKSLADFLETASPVESQKVLAELRKGFVTDATLANYDVIGLSLDNVIVDARGVPWRIDNGGSLRFRAQGAPKATWNGAVTELETMRDAAVNPQAARIFADITEGEIEEQIRDLLTREDAILAALPDPVKPIMRERFATLRTRLDQLVNEDVVKRVKEAKIQGISLPSDRDEFEDVQFLLWEEIGEDGNPLTAAKLKLTPNGAEKVMQQIQSSIPKKPKAPAIPKPLPDDNYWARIEQALKTINHHAGDGQYNLAKIEAMKAVKAELAALNTPTKTLQEMKAHYEAVINSAEQAIAGKHKTTIFEQFTVKPPAPKTPKPTAVPKFNIKAEDLTWSVKDYSGGVVRRTAHQVAVEGNILKQEGYVIDIGGVRLRFIPYRDATIGSLGKTNAQALMGQLEVEIAGAATRENLNRAIDALKQIGLSPTKASSDYLEAVWLRKTLAMRTDLIDNATRARIREIMELPGITDADRVAQLRQIAQQKLGIDPPRDSSMWMPRTTTTGRGWGYTERWDMTASQIEKEMQGYSVAHKTGMAIPDLVEKLLEQGGELTSTAERVRKGINITTGMSPSADLQRGGATHVFTRIKSTAEAYRTPGLVFKRSVLARQDAFSFHADWYGGVDNFFRTEQIYSARGKTIDDLKKFAQRQDNETLFKWGLSLLDELDVIVVPNTTTKRQVLQRFKAAGITKLADGRAVDSVVRIASDPIP